VVSNKSVRRPSRGLSNVELEHSPKERPQTTLPLAPFWFVEPGRTSIDCPPSPWWNRSAWQWVMDSLGRQDNYMNCMMNAMSASDAREGTEHSEVRPSVKALAVRRIAWAWLAGVALIGCGGGHRATSSDARGDGTVVAADTAGDVGSDERATAPDAPDGSTADTASEGSGRDVGADVMADVPADVAAPTDAPDAAGDRAQDRPPDDGPPLGMGDASSADGGPSCNPPPALLAPTSETVSQAYDVAMAQSPTAGIGVLWSRWPSGYDPPFARFEPTTLTFGTTAPIVSDQQRSAEHVAVTTLPDGRFAAAWGSYGGLSPDFLYASIGPETSSPVTYALSYGGVRQHVPSVAIAPFGSDRVAVAWADIAPGGDDPVVVVDVRDLALNEVQQISITPRNTNLLIVNAAAVGDQLFVFIDQSVPNDPAAHVERSMVKVAQSTMTATPLKLLSTTTGSVSTVAFTATTMAQAYSNGTDLLLATFDLDGNPVGSPQTIMPSGSTGSMQLYRIASAYHLLRFVSDANYGTLHYHKLAADAQPLSDVTLGNVNVPRPVALFQTTSALLVGWYSMKGVYLSPLCP
jgi:hypothetical protein